MKERTAKDFTRTELFRYGYQTAIAILERGEENFKGQFLLAIKLLLKSEKKIMTNIKRQMEHGMKNTKNKAKD